MKLNEVKVSRHTSNEPGTLSIDMAEGDAVIHIIASDDPRTFDGANAYAKEDGPITLPTLLCIALADRLTKDEDFVLDILRGFDLQEGMTRQ